MQFVFSREPDARQTSRDFVRQLDRSIDDLSYELDVFRLEEQRAAQRVKKLVEGGERARAKTDCAQIANLRRQMEVVARYVGVLQQSKTSLMVVSAMDTIQTTIRVTDALMHQVNARFRGTLAADGMRTHAAEMDANLAKVEETMAAIFGGEAASADAVLAEFTGEDPDLDALKNFQM